MPQLMPIFWVFSVFVIMIVLIMVFMKFFNNKEDLFYYGKNIQKNSNWEW